MESEKAALEKELDECKKTASAYFCSSAFYNEDGTLIMMSKYVSHLGSNIATRVCKRIDEINARLAAINEKSPK